MYPSYKLDLCVRKALVFLAICWIPIENIRATNPRCKGKTKRILVQLPEYMQVDGGVVFRIARFVMKIDCDE